MARRRYGVITDTGLSKLLHDPETMSNDGYSRIAWYELGCTMIQRGKALGGCHFMPHGWITTEIMFVPQSILPLTP